jgi:hypothetical protein
VAGDGLEEVAEESGREVATAATVWSRRGVDAYVMVSPSNATLVKGKTATGDALGKESLSPAAAEGLREDRSNSPGARTLGMVSATFGVQEQDNSRIDDVGDAVEQDGVRKGDLCVVDPSRTVRQDGKGQIGALKRRHGDITQGGREDDVVGDDMELEDFLKCLEISRLQN